METLGVEAANLAAARDEPQPFLFHERRAANAFERPIVYAASRQLFAAVLPEKLAVLFIERQ